MNVCLPLPDGSVTALSEHEARVLDAYLAQREETAPVADRASIARLRARLKPITDPETAYDASYEPPGAMPAWEPQP